MPGDCERCSGFDRQCPATVKITYGLYSTFKAGRPHHIVLLCSECAHDLYEGNGCVALKSLVTTGLCHFVVEKP